MATRLAIIGLDTIHQEWLDAVAQLRAAGQIELVGVGHRAQAAARDVAESFKAGPGGELPPTYDELRLLLKERSPQVLLMDRPPNATIEFLRASVAEGIAILSLGPPVESLAEAQELAEELTPRTHLLCTWPRFAEAPVFKHCAQADDYVRPFRFAAATWLGLNHALARSLVSRPGETPVMRELPVRSLSALAWDAIGTLIDLIQLPMSVYGVVRGTVGTGSSFGDLTGAASLTLRFEDDVSAAITLCDRMPTPLQTAGGVWRSRDLMLWGSGGTVRLSHHDYEFRDNEGNLVDAGIGTTQDAQSASREAVGFLREFLRHYQLPPSPHRGWIHRLEDVAATMEALVVSHRTGQAESPERFRKLRR